MFPCASLLLLSHYCQVSRLSGGRCEGTVTLEFTCAGLARDAPTKNSLDAPPRLIKRLAIRRKRFVGKFFGLRGCLLCRLATCGTVIKSNVDLILNNFGSKEFFSLDKNTLGVLLHPLSWDEIFRIPYIRTAYS